MGDVMYGDTARFSDELYYSNSHIWALVDENVLTLGVTHPALEKLGEILYIDSHEVGDRIVQGNRFAVIESVKNVLDLMSPVNGLIFELNSLVIETPFVINDDPYGDGWIFKAEIESEKDLVQMMRAPEYCELLKTFPNASGFFFTSEASGIS